MSREEQMRKLLEAAAAAARKKTAEQQAGPAGDVVTAQPEQLHDAEREAAFAELLGGTPEPAQPAPPAPAAQEPVPLQSAEPIFRPPVAQVRERDEREELEDLREATESALINLKSEDVIGQYELRLTLRHKRGAEKKAKGGSGEILNYIDEKISLLEARLKVSNDLELKTVEQELASMGGLISASELQNVADFTWRIAVIERLIPLVNQAVERSRHYEDWHYLNLWSDWQAKLRTYLRDLKARRENPTAPVQPKREDEEPHTPIGVLYNKLVGKSKGQPKPGRRKSRVVEEFAAGQTGHTDFSEFSEAPTPAFQPPVRRTETPSRAQRVEEVRLVGQAPAAEHIHDLGTSPEIEFGPNGEKIARYSMRAVEQIIRSIVKDFAPKVEIKDLMVYEHLGGQWGIMASRDAGLIGGKLSIDADLDNEANFIAVHNADVRGRSAKKLGAFLPQLPQKIVDYFTNLEGREVESVQIFGTQFIVKYKAETRPQPTPAPTRIESPWLPRTQQDEDAPETEPQPRPFDQIYREIVNRALTGEPPPPSRAAVEKTVEELAAMLSKADIDVSQTERMGVAEEAIVRMGQDISLKEAVVMFSAMLGLLTGLNLSGTHGIEYLLNAGFLAGGSLGGVLNGLKIYRERRQAVKRMKYATEHTGPGVFEEIWERDPVVAIMALSEKYEAIKNKLQDPNLDQESKRWLADDLQHINELQEIIAAKRELGEFNGLYRLEAFIKLRSQQIQTGLDSRERRFLEKYKEELRGASLLDKRFGVTATRQVWAVARGAVLGMAAALGADLLLIPLLQPHADKINKFFFSHFGSEQSLIDLPSLKTGMWDSSSVIGTYLKYSLLYKPAVALPWLNKQVRGQMEKRRLRPLDAQLSGQIEANPADYPPARIFYERLKIRDPETMPAQDRVLNTFILLHPESEEDESKRPLSKDEFREIKGLVGAKKYPEFFERLWQMRAGKPPEFRSMLDLAAQYIGSLPKARREYKKYSARINSLTEQDQEKGVQTYEPSPARSAKAA